MHQASSILKILAVCALAGLIACPSNEGRPSASSREESTPWSLLEASGTRLSLRVAEGGCFSFRRVEVDEEATQVTLTAISELSSSTTVICEAVLHYQRVSATLESPLGERPLKHAPVSSKWNGPTK